MSDQELNSEESPVHETDLPNEDQPEWMPPESQPEPRPTEPVGDQPSTDPVILDGPAN